MKVFSLVTTLFAVTMVTVSCSSRGSSDGAVARDSIANSANATPAGASTAASSSTDSIVRGTVASVSDSVLVVKAPNGDIRVVLTQPVTVYERRKADLSRVTDKSFVGVTSIPQPDGTQRATEIHVFPEELRGLGEGSRPMGSANDGRRSTMTNGSVAPSRMTNGNARMTNGAARMTNGTSREAAPGTIVVTYNGGSQSIAVPAGVEVTEIARTDAKLVPGTLVIIPALKQPNGILKTSRVMLAAPATSGK